MYLHESDLQKSVCHCLAQAVLDGPGNHCFCRSSGTLAIYHRTSLDLELTDVIA